MLSVGKVSFNFEEVPRVTDSANIKVIDGCKTTNLVTVDTFRNGDHTIAEAKIIIPWGNNGNSKMYIGKGTTAKADEDKENYSIAESISTSRALRKLAALILEDAMDEVHLRCGNRRSQYEKMEIDELVSLREQISKTISYKRNVQKEKEAIAIKKKEENKKLKEKGVN